MNVELLNKIELLGLEYVESNPDVKKYRDESFEMMKQDSRTPIRHELYKMYYDTSVYYSEEYLLNETEETLLEKDAENYKEFEPLGHTLISSDTLKCRGE